MNLRDFRIGWRLLISEPVYSLVVVVGLALGFAASFLLLGYVRYSFTYDTQVPDNEHVYLVKSRVNIFSPPLWGTNVAFALSGIARKSGLTTANSTVHDFDGIARVGDRAHKIHLSAVDTDFPKIFGIQTVAGDLQSTLVRPDAIALTVGEAQKIFGNTGALQKIVNIDGKPYEVGALLPNLPSNTGEPYDALVGSNTTALPEDTKDRNKWNAGGRLYLKLKPNVSTAEIEKLFQNGEDQFGIFADRKSEWPQLGFQSAVDIRLISLADYYFDPDLEKRGEHANRKVVVGLALVAMLIIFLAATNYVNLAIVRTLRRQREIGLRKVLGASVKHIIRQFIAESMLVSIFATIVGLLIAWLLLPLFSELMSRKLDMLFSVHHLICAFFFGITIGLFTGIYPSVIAIRSHPGETAAGRANHETSGGMWVRRILTVMQFSTAMGFTGLTLAIVWQTYFASNFNPGFNPAHLEIIDMPDDLTSPACLQFRDKVSHLKGISGVASSGSPPGGNMYKVSGWSKTKDGKSVLITYQNISANYFDVYQVRPRAGRLFNPSDDTVDNENVTVINAKAALMLGFSSPDAAVGQPNPEDGGKSTIVGIAPDLSHQSIREADQPVKYALSNRTSVLTVRIDGDSKTVEKEIESLWVQSFPTDELIMRSAKAALSESYADDLRLAKLLGASSALAIAIAAFGIYVLSAYSVQRRKREIVMRKLFGADSGAIAKLLAKEFGFLVALSALIGLPIAAFASAKYLAEFVERAPMGAWPLVGALLIASMVAFFGILRHALMAIRMSPMIALKN